MVKLVLLVRRAEGVSVDDLRARSAEAVRNAAAGLAGRRRHVESLALPGGYRRGEPVYDAVHELWFTDETSAQAARASSGVTVLGSCGVFDPRTLVALVVEDHLVKDGAVPRDGLKSVEFVTRLADLPRAEFRRYWREVHGPLAGRIEVMRRYVQSHCVPSSYEQGQQPVWDGLAITWFEDIAAMRASAATPEYAMTRADEPNFLAPGELPFVITTEREVDLR